jgi:hypothetical protein
MQYEIFAAGERCAYFDSMVALLQHAGIDAKQIAIADYDRLAGYVPEVHPRGTEVYVLVPNDQTVAAREILKSQ